MCYQAELRCVGPDDFVGGSAVLQHKGLRLPEGFCFLVSRESGAIVQPVFEYFAYSTLTRTRSPELCCAVNSARAWAEDLADFHHFLDARCTYFNDIDEPLLQAYANDLMTSVSPVTHKRF